MASFQEIRDYLEQHQEGLALTLDAKDRAEFQETFRRLQRDWEQEDDEQTKLEITLEEMHKYRPVWQELEAANLIADATRTISTSNLTPVSEPSHPQARSHVSPHQHKESPPKNGQPSQSVVDSLAIWDKRMAFGKELLTGCMGGAIVVVTLVIAIATIYSVNNQATYAAAKDILLFMNGLVGVVLGYYFGRVPADIRTDKAQSETMVANSQRDQVLSTVRTVLDESSRSIDRNANAGSINLTPEQVESLSNVLRQYGR